MHVQDLDYGWTSDEETSRKKMMETALEALRLAPQDYDSHWAVGSPPCAPATSSGLSRRTSARWP
jgi:hypothetical protein